MKIYHGIEDFSPLSYAVVTTGTFDGVHIGHQKILNRLTTLAKSNKGESVVITYWPHPRLVLKPEDTSIRLLNTFEEKADLLKKFGIDHLIRIPFTKEFSQLSSDEYINEILVKKIGTKKLVIGYDHRFGKNREGSFEELKKNAQTYGFEVEEIPRQDIDHAGVSSTRIRKALAEADVLQAKQLLGSSYALTGRVIAGDKIGRMLGFPTANIELDYPYKLIPADAIYAVTISHERVLYKGMLYIGTRPTINGTKRNIEVNIFDFDKSIYGETISINFEHLIRSDAAFSDLESLKKQLALDKIKALELLT
ncbi:MAG: bifunctional riboflavin kinase/FAD synthetase [Cyclobacteriaceae bacterium]|jgi:riboflavin kinase/FMN adenylyltransferase|nr:bifunctional riboflavin kinase/FAD synthetase [Cyclobacteriaceae bacterium]